MIIIHILIIVTRVIIAMSILVAIRFTWTPKVCKIMAFRAVIMGLGLLFYVLLGFR